MCSAETLTLYVSCARLTFWQYGTPYGNCCEQIIVGHKIGLMISDLVKLVMKKTSMSLLSAVF